MDTFRYLVACSLLAVQSLLATAAERLDLKNGSFSQWENGAPADWTVDIGARSGSDTPSKLKPLNEEGLELSGDANTGQWKSVSQKVALTQGAEVRLQFEARTIGLKREARQFNNCYVGLAAFDGAGKRLSIQIRELFETNWAPGQLVAKLPDNAASVDVLLFLSKTGVLQVRSIRLERLEAADSFDVLVDELDRYYSFFATKNINWRERAVQYRSAAQGAKNTDEFVTAVQPLLAELKDLHVGIETPEGKQMPTFVSAVDRDFDARTIAGQLSGVKQIGRMGFIGRTPEGFGYVAIGTLSADRKTTDDMLAAFDTLLNSKGLIIDLRVNGGGNELVAQQFVSRLVAEPLVYASNQFRGGAAYGDLLKVGTRQVVPSSQNAYRGNVVGLIGPGCVSSGEGFALMLAALPKGKLIGKPTRGASGNPQPVLLPNGVKVTYSIWVPLQSDGKPFEGVGIAPDIRIEDDPTGSKGLQAAIEALKLVTK
jgi:hypothetical protein